MLYVGLAGLILLFLLAVEATSRWVEKVVAHRRHCRAELRRIEVNLLGWRNQKGS